MSPAPSNLIANKYNAWHEWFNVPNSKVGHFAMADNCDKCEYPGKVPYTTGNFMGCYWYNRNCDMNVAKNECKKCTCYKPGNSCAGTCSRLRYSPNSAYRANSKTSHFAYNRCRSHWWHTAPSIGYNGRNCACFKPKA